MNYKRFEELPCWNQARELSQAVFKIINMVIQEAQVKCSNKNYKKDWIPACAGMTCFSITCIIVCHPCESRDPRTNKTTWVFYISRIINYEKFRKDFSLRDQIWRAAGSIMDNIAEGFDDGSTRE